MVQPPPLSTGSGSLFVTDSPVVFPTWHDPAFIGPLLIGTLMQFGIFCIVLIQVVVFFARQGHDMKDGRLLKLYVAAVFLFTALEIAFGVWRIYNICVLLRPWALLPATWFEVVLNPIVVESVHGFFIFRCYKLSRSKLVLGVVSFMLLMQLTAAVVAMVFNISAAQFGRIYAATLAVCFATAVLDTAISAILITNLWRQRTGRIEVDVVVLRIIRITLESNIPCLICIVFILIGIVNLGTVPLGPLFPMAISVAAPLYANALLTTLNSRPILRRQLDGDHDIGRLSTRDNVQFHHPESDQSRQTSHPSTRHFTDSAQRSNMSYDIAFTNSMGPSSSGGGGSDQITSKARSLVSGDHDPTDLRPNYPPTLSTKATGDLPLAQA